MGLLISLEHTMINELKQEIAKIKERLTDLEHRCVAQSEEDADLEGCTDTELIDWAEASGVEMRRMCSAETGELTAWLAVCRITRWNFLEGRGKTWRQAIENLRLEIRWRRAIGDMPTANCASNATHSGGSWC